MPTALRNLPLVFSVCLAIAASAATDIAVAQTKPSPKTTQQTPTSGDNASADADDGDTPNDELEEAAVKIDVSHSSPLIQKLYQATRETKEQDILARLVEAKKILANGADVKATDQYGRTALHWTVFGSSYNTKPSVVVSYEEMADQLLQKGVEINHEDVYKRHRTRLSPLLSQL
jgi:ankyrin repeat protein